MLSLGRIALLALVLVAGTLAFGSAAYEVVEEDRSDEGTLHVASISSELSASAYVVFDVATGRVLLAENADTPRPIASVTKLLAAAAVHDLFELEATTTLAWADVAAHGSAGKLTAQQTYSYRELLFPLLLSSSNDAALTYERRSDDDGLDLLTHAEVLARDAYAPSVKLADASGLSDENVASARDLARVASSLYQTHPYIFSVSRHPSYLGPYHGWQNNSPFIDEAAYIGGKHGFTNAAGRTAVALFAENVAGTEYPLGYVVLGSNDVAHDVALLREHVARSAEWR